MTGCSRRAATCGRRSRVTRRLTTPGAAQDGRWPSTSPADSTSCTPLASCTGVCLFLPRSLQLLLSPSQNLFAARDAMWPSTSLAPSLSALPRRRAQAWLSSRHYGQYPPAMTLCSAIPAAGAPASLLLLLLRRQAMRFAVMAAPHSPPLIPAQHVGFCLFRRHTNAVGVPLSTGT